MRSLPGFLAPANPDTHDLLSVGVNTIRCARGEPLRDMPISALRFWLNDPTDVGDECQMGVYDAGGMLLGASAVENDQLEDLSPSGAVTPERTLDLVEPVWVREGQGYYLAWGVATLDTPVAITWNLTANVASSVAGTTLTKNAGSAWAESGYSTEGLTATALLTWQPSQTNKGIMFGLNSDPATDANYTSMDYAFWTDEAGNLSIYESNTQTANCGTYTAATELKITYDGTNVRWYKAGVLQRTVARAVGAALHVDSSFNHTGGAVNSIRFSEGLFPALYSADYLIQALATPIDPYRAFHYYFNTAIPLPESLAFGSAAVSRQGFQMAAIEGT